LFSFFSVNAVFKLISAKVSALAALASKVMLLGRLLFKLDDNKDDIYFSSIFEVLTFCCCYSSEGG